MKLLIFTEGTILKESTDIDDFSTYIPIGNAVAKIQEWKAAGHDIHYLTSRTREREICEISKVLQTHLFPDNNNLHYRRRWQSYAKVAQQIMPNVIIEDDCASIGGEFQMIFPNIKPEIRKHIRSVVIKEFSGIDNVSL